MPPRGRPPHPSRTRTRTAAPVPPSAPDPTESRKLFRVAGLAAVSALFAHEPERVERLFFDERLTTHAAQSMLLDAGLSRQKRKERLDKLAATLILQAYLDASRT